MRGTLNYISSLHRPARSSLLNLMDINVGKKIELRMTLSDDEKILYICDLIGERLHVLHVEDSFFNGPNLYYQYNALDIYYPEARPQCERGDF
jgi:hypothetical protein